jgi:hypothetical protein
MRPFAHRRRVIAPTLSAGPVRAVGPVGSVVAAFATATALGSPAHAESGAPSGREGQISVCVDVQLKSWKAPPPPQAPQAPPAPQAPVASSVPADAPAGQPTEPTSPGSTPEAPPAAVSPPPVPNPTTDTAGTQAPRRPRPAPTLPPSPSDDPFAVQPERYLKRMVEYEVTHLDGFEAVPRGCSQTVTVEMYPLPDGWTVFARYTGTAREEKVDRVQVDELGALAQRLTDALLYDKSVSETINRQNVSARGQRGANAHGRRPRLLHVRAGHVAARRVAPHGRRLGRTRERGVAPADAPGPAARLPRQVPGLGPGGRSCAACSV